MTLLYTLPVPPVADHVDYAYYQAFVHEMNQLPHTMTIGVKLRTAIERAAHRMEISPAHVARLLVDYGLRAPRNAFPESFLDFVDQCPPPRNLLDRIAFASDVVALKDFWTGLMPHGADERLMETA